MPEQGSPAVCVLEFAANLQCLFFWQASTTVCSRAYCKETEDTERRYSVGACYCMFVCLYVCECESELHMWAGSMRAPIDRILGTHGRWQPRRRRRTSTAGSAPPQPQHRARARVRPQPSESRKSLAVEQIKLWMHLICLNNTDGNEATLPSCVACTMLQLHIDTHILYYVYVAICCAVCLCVCVCASVNSWIIII